MSKGIPIDIVSGFLGSGKTTLINALLRTVYKGENVAIIENEFGEVDVDSTLLPDGIEITKMTGGCVCCTLKVNLIEGIKALCERFALDRIVIETTGVAKLSDVAATADSESLMQIAYTNSKITVVNPAFHLQFSDVLGAFYTDQIDNANIIYLSREAQTDADVHAEAKRSIVGRGGKKRIFSQVADFAAGGGAGHLHVQSSERDSGQAGGVRAHKANGCKHEVDGCKHVQNECDSKDNGCEHGRNEDEDEDIGRNRLVKAHTHADVVDDDEFYSFMADEKSFDDKEALEETIERMVADKLPDTVFRIKGHVRIGGQSMLVQWVYGDLKLSAAAEQDSKLVVIVGRE